jgi:hypothetical protein
MRSPIRAAVAAAALLGASWLPVHTALAKPIDNCTVTSIATVRWTTDGNHHVIKGRWSLHPVINCNHGKLKLSIKAVLRHHGDVQMRSKGTCTATASTTCRTAEGPKKTRHYGKNIRGTWNVFVHFAMTGPDAQTIAASNPDKCHYEPSSFTAKCYYVDGPYHIK